MRRRTRTIGLLTATAALALTACTPAGYREPSAGTTPPKQPAAALADAAAHLKITTFKMTMTVKIDTTDARLDGLADPARKLGTFTATTTSKNKTTIVEWRIVENTVYSKSSTPGLGGTSGKPWRRSNPADGGSFAESFDGAKMATPLAQAANVQRTGTHHFSGTFATTAVAQALSLPTPSSSAGATPPPNVSFTADLDEQGRLTHYHLDIPRAKGGTYPLDLGA